MKPILPALTLSAASVLGTPAVAGYTVEGDSVRFDDDSWYQIQRVIGSDGGNDCQGAGLDLNDAACNRLVSGRRYRVINHSTGARGTEFTASSAAVPGRLAPRHADGRISWSDTGGWMEVLHEGSVVPGCEGRKGMTSCSVAGRSGVFEVIDHSNGYRESITVDAAGASFEPAPADAAPPPDAPASALRPTLAGSVISWRDTGGYMEVIAYGGRALPGCEGRKGLTRCDVGSQTGVFEVIDHSNGYRESVEVKVSGGSGPTAGPVDARALDCGSEPWVSPWGFLQPDEYDDYVWHGQERGPLLPGFKGTCFPNGPITNRADIEKEWAGTGEVTVGPIGRNFSITWNNTGPVNDNGLNHSEFDISVARDINSASRHGYGNVSLGRALEADMVMTARAHWEDYGDRRQGGKAHVQSIIWLTADENAEPNANRGTEGDCPIEEIGITDRRRRSIDITVVEWLTPYLEASYDDYRNSVLADGYDTRPPAGIASNTRYIGDVSGTADLNGNGIQDGDGADYHVFRRLPGDICEVASYFAVRSTPRPFESSVPQNTRVDAGGMIEAIHRLDRPRFRDGAEVSSTGGTALFDLNEWYVSNIGWEIAGANGDADPASENSDGTFTFECYSVPGLREEDDARRGEAFDRCF